MKGKRNSFLLLLSVIFMVNVIMILTYVVITPGNPFTSIIHGQTPSIPFKPNQKQTTFFEKYPTDGPTFTPVPIPTRTEPTDKPQPTPRPGTTQAPIPTFEAGLNVCTPNQEKAENCICTFEGYSDRKNYLCPAPPNDIAITRYLYTGSAKAHNFMEASYPYKFMGSHIKAITADEYNAATSNPECKRTCIEFDKPIIYLYPEKPTYVSVRLDVPGNVINSIPLYPEGGWQNVLAYPDGTLHYQGKTYSELFYETSVPDLIPRKYAGTVIKTEHLRTELDTLITKTGLEGKEKADFMEYWVPRLTQLNSEAIFVRLLTHEEKNLTDRVVIEPKPDTFIEVLFEFYPVTSDFEHSPMQNIHPPVRKGFTAVEWGGAVMPML